MARANATLRVRRGQPEDAAALAAFAARTFTDAFGAANSAADLAAHLASVYGVAQQGRELADSTYSTLLIEEDNQLAGYAQVRHAHTPACVTAQAPIELYRFYVDRVWHGCGVAQRLMVGVHEAARELGGRSVWLSVWERNPRAIAFYAKCGFRDVGVTDFFVGSDRQTDRVMMAEVDYSKGNGVV